LNSLRVGRPFAPPRAVPRPQTASGGPDTVLIATVGSLVAIGLVMILSASSATAYAFHHDSTYFLKRQLIWLCIGLGAAVVAYRCDYRALRGLAPLVVGLSLVSLVAVLVPHVGLVSNGARRWLGAGSVSFEPSEFAKLALVLYLASALTIKGERLRSLVRGLFPIVTLTLAFVLLVFKEPDTGTASLLAFTAAVLFFVGGARLAHLALIALVTLPPAALLVLTQHYQRARLLAFLDPWKDPLNSGFHIVQSLYALGSGGWIGVGLGFSRQKFFYLPEQYTDFIFAIIGEELGLLGTVVVLALFVLFAYRAVRIALAAPDRFGFLLALGCAAVIMVQAFINIGVVTSSWPVTGVPLPFISFGGSSLVVSLVASALIVNVGRHRSRASS
jgi:cell division protein FtsW